MLQNEVGQQRYVIVARVERGDVTQIATAGSAKDFRVLHRDFFERFQAVRREARTDDIEPLQPALAECDDGFVGVRPQPLFPAYAGLKSDGPEVVVEAERFGDQACRLEAVAVVRIATQQVLPR